MLEDKQEMIALLTGVKSSKRNYYTELKETVGQLRKKNMQLEIISEVMKSMKVDMSPEEILQNVIEKLRALIQFERFSLLLLHDSQLILTNVYPKDSYTLEVGTPIPHENSLYWSALSKRQTIFQDLIEEQASFYEKPHLLELGISTVLILPIYSKKKRIGILSIGCRGSSDWGIDDLAFLEQLTDHLAVSIENAQLYNEVLRGKQQWEDTFKAVNDMIIVFDEELRVLQCNDAVREFFQMEGGLDVPMLHEMHKELLRETFLSKKPGYIEVYFPNGSICEMYTYPVQNNEQQVYGVIAYIKDVTEKRKVELQLQHSGKLAAIGEMAAGIAHELNSPLTAILGNAQLLLRSTAEQNASFTLLKDIHSCGSRCKTIIKSLLTFSRQDEYLFSPCSLNEAIGQVLHLLQGQLKQQRITITQLLEPSLPLVEASQSQIEQVIINLLLNARDAIEEKNYERGEIVVRTFWEQDCACISISDNGIGIEESRLSQIFHPFYTTKGVGKGTGLGLSVSIGIAKAHGGAIEVHSRVYEGSTFTLRLPLQFVHHTEV
ncbi:PAS domain-containing sensor histidine kinase [Ectobacillus funiculus]|uniref:PAS domain-containing sensor histidine kinase n=1 Tax=Ectobacillus funiculus TaxID=137993 RepID=UPI00101BE7B8|nr:ATP-binding protein [Ectobacillus funiculus]